MTPRRSRVPLLLAALLSCQEAVAQVLTETSFVTINDVTTMYTCAPSTLPMCSEIVWDALTTSSDTQSVGPTGTDTAQATVTETQTEAGPTDTITEIDISTEVESVTRTITQFTSSSSTFSTSLGTPVSSIAVGEAVNLAITDPSGNPLLLIVDPNTGVVRFVGASDPDAASAQQVFPDAAGVFHLVSDPNVILGFGDPNTGGRRGRLQKRQDIDPATMRLLARIREKFGPGSVIVSWGNDNGAITIKTPDGKLLDIYVSADGGDLIPTDAGAGPPPGLNVFQASVQALAVATTQSVTGAPLSTLITGSPSSVEPSSTSSSTSTASSSSSADPLTTLISSYSAFCSTLLGHVTALTTETAATPTTVIPSTIGIISTDLSRVAFKTISTQNAANTLTRFNPTNTSPPAVAKRRSKRQTATTPAALTTYSADALSSACQGLIGTSWTPVTSTERTTPAAATSRPPVTSVTRVLTTSTFITTQYTGQATTVHTAGSTTIRAATQTSMWLRATVSGSAQYAVLSSIDSSNEYSLNLQSSSTGAGVFYIDDYGRIGTAVGATPVQHFLKDPTAGTPATGRAKFAPNTAAGLATGYWLSFYSYVIGAATTPRYLVIDPQRNNPATPAGSNPIDTSTGEHVFLMCTYPNATPAITTPALAFGVSGTTNAGGTCTAITFEMVPAT